LQPPVPIGPWSGVFDATEDGPVCPQATGLMSDDCLHLNVYTLLMPDASKREKADLKPVIAYVGGFMLESGGSNTTLEGPEYLLDYNVTLVTINYRLGILGFIATKEIAGNNGFKDQQVALRWIRDNIKDFGGDPKSVTFMGWSGGARSIGYHLRSYSSDGLFQRAIMMSGGLPQHVDRFRRDLPYIQIDPIVKTAALVGCNQTYLDEKIECLRNTHSRKLGNTFPHMRDEFQCPGISWRVLNEPNFGQEKFDNYKLEYTYYSQIPVLAGFVKDELFHHAVLNYDNPKGRKLWENETEVDNLLEKCVLAEKLQFKYLKQLIADDGLLKALDKIFSVGIVKHPVFASFDPPRSRPGARYLYINTHYNGLSKFSYGGSNNCK
jgi:carboxylesterase type B